MHNWPSQIRKEPGSLDECECSSSLTKTNLTSQIINALSTCFNRRPTPTRTRR